MELFQDLLSKEVYRSIYNRVKDIKNSWWVCIVENKFQDGEPISTPVLVAHQASNFIEACNKAAMYSIITNELVDRNINPTEYEWEENPDSDVIERYLQFSIVKISRKGDTVLWRLVSPEEMLKEYM